MSLTSPTTQYVSIMAAVCATTAVLLLWNRVRGPRAVRLLSRCGLLIGGYAATAVAVLVSVNIAYGGLIVSVNDLFADLNPPMNYHHTGHMHAHHRAVAPGPSTTPSPKATASPTASAGPDSAGVSGLAG
ncbi:hypothetical protein KDL01_34420 [Actinospica durhamensis]|uniref:Uncharacterized protein n=1 Tax=Actinospica durhamensis TaxID=1508375 RepID=A0A941EU73_9ACTN|nr:hypothetical protein [Actinospica durhamensis]MBR7838415.1 hypothetical protein [Actinospica durhamensis]